MVVMKTINIVEAGTYILTNYISHAMKESLLFYKYPGDCYHCQSFE